jgi:hypothetical protein
MLLFLLIKLGSNPARTNTEVFGASRFSLLLLQVKVRERRVVLSKKSASFSNVQTKAVIDMMCFDRSKLLQTPMIGH